VTGLASIALLPTPLTPLDRLARTLGTDARLSVKRDDLTGLALGGKKARN
jgi:1-aminocyclopropane-1-carboxylate deaminase/D-cysteine desulfhydrase-like pyridoxal-dependent ACC family enzyme